MTGLGLPAAADRLAAHFRRPLVLVQIAAANARGLYSTEPDCRAVASLIDFRSSSITFGRMRLNLTPEQRDFVRRAVESGRLERAEDALQEALSLWVERERRRPEILAAVDAAQASIERGEGIEIAPQSMRELAKDVKQQGLARLAAERPTTTR